VSDASIAQPSVGGEKQLHEATPEGETCQHALAPISRRARFRATALRLVRTPHFWAAVVLLGLITGACALAVPYGRAWYHRRAARAEMALYHNPQAIRHLQECLDYWSNDPEILVMAARTARRAGKYGEAEELLKKCQQVRGLDEEGSFEQLLLFAECRVDQAADVCWHHIEQCHPDTPLILEALTRGYLRQYRLKEAGMCLNRWLDSEPNNAQAHCLNGLYLLDYVHARSRAELSYRRAVELDPEHEIARLGLAIVLVDTKNFSEAAEHLTFLRQRQPNNLSVQVGLAECRAGEGNEAEAVRLLEAVLDRDPNFEPAISLLGRLALEDADYEQAEARLRRAVALNPRDVLAGYNLIMCLQKNGKNDEAQEKKRHQDQLQKDLERFHEIINKELAVRPNDPALHFTLGQLLLRGGHNEDGVRWLTSALRLDPQYAPAREALAEHQRQQAGQTPR
jgi:tetratricopeptide (TPR) repeat protein